MVEMQSKINTKTGRRDGDVSGAENPEDTWGPPPPYRVCSTGAVLSSSVDINEAGLVDINFSSSRPNDLDSLLAAASSPDSHHPESSASQDPKSCPPLNIVVQVVGSRGDVQPFIALGVALQRYGHRVRLATHDTFENFVHESGLEFYPIGGDPEDLMAYMVKNPGLIPSMESLRGGDIGRKRKMIHEMLRGCWKSCVAPDPHTRRPFVADAIIANPPSFAHVHCAERLSIPLHMMFTMPWTATRAFPHPLANVKAENMSSKSSNFLSYGVVDLMTWQGLGDVINSWRTRDLGLDALPHAVGADIVNIMKIPHTYCWSPALVPKPADWGNTIDVCGFFMRDEPEYTPPDDLTRFLSRGPKPIYIGFGSIVLEDPARVTEIIKTACQQMGVRVIVSRGWSKLGGDEDSTDGVFYLGNCPHEWLFKRVAAVIHHGGAGTTACGLINGLPTTIPFWGSVIASTGAGPEPIPYKRLSVESLAGAIGICLSSSAQASAVEIAQKMRRENGVEAAVASFHRQLDFSALTCDCFPERTARWVYCTKTKKQKRNIELKLSDEVLRVLLLHKHADLRKVKTYGARTYHIENERWDPLTAGASSTLATVTDFTYSLGGTFVDPFREMKRVKESADPDAPRTAVAAAAVGRGVTGMGTSMAKGTLVDMPLAIAEGLRVTPKLFGEEVRDVGKVTDWKSGSAVAAKTFGWGFYDGVVGVVTKPVEGAMKGGTLGFLKGVTQGSMGLVTKPGAGMFGLLAYPAQGAYKSARSMFSGPAMKAQRDGRVSALEDDARGGEKADEVQIMRKFQELTA